MRKVREEEPEIPMKTIRVKRRVARNEVQPLNTHLLQADIPIVNYDKNLLVPKQYTIIYELVE